MSHSLAAACRMPALATLLAAAASLAAAQSQKTPFAAVVTADAAPVLSGPGAQYYQTGVAAKGETVEVHRVVGDFLGVRPPDGAFSWAPGVDIADAEPGFGRVLRDGTPSRVGSVTSDRRNVVHVRLQKGERVRVLARVMVDGSEWVHIAPPSGEFRWLRAADVGEAGTDNPPAAVKVDEPAEVSAKVDPPIAEPAEFSAEATPLENWVQAAAHAEPAAPTQQAPVAPAATAEPASPAAPPPPMAQPTAPAAAPAPLPSSPQPSVGSAEMGFANAKAALEVRVARRVSQPAAAWDFTDLAVEANRLVALATRPEEQAAGAALVARIKTFTQLAERQRLLAAAPRPTPPARTAPLTTPPSTPPSTELVGELRPVVSQQADAPKFALVDANGQVLTFLSASAGMDLQGLLGKQVSVTGQRGYLPAIGKPHVSATRVAQTPPQTLR
ncbi:MAG: hypothetical protein AAGJ46_14980 [Planctomycetota bacterium]